MEPMITPDMKVDEALRLYPGVLSVFVDFGFKALQNALLRRTFAHLISIRGAAALHRWNAERLAQFLDELNARALVPCELPLEIAPDEALLYDLRDIEGLRAQGILIQPDFIEIDNRGLEPPEPMVRILAVAQQLAPGQRMVALNARRPMLLYPKLDELGLQHETEAMPDGLFRISVMKARGA